MQARRRVELSVLLDDLQRIFGDRLGAVVAYGHVQQRPAPSLAIVDVLLPEDLAACAERVAAWHKAGAATPLLLTEREFAGSADAFPIEYAEIVDTAVLLHGTSPFAAIGGIDAGDVRRACEVQVRSHLLHLREDYLDCGANPTEVAAFVSESAAAFAVILRRLARLFGETADTAAELVSFSASYMHLDARVVGDLLVLDDPQQAGTVDAVRIFPPYIETLERLARFVDEWPRQPEPSLRDAQEAGRSPADSRHAEPAVPRRGA